MRTRIAAVIALVVFLVLTGTGISFAYWSSSAQTHGDIAVADLTSANCSSPTRIVNGSFESPAIGAASYQLLAPNAVPGWTVQNDNAIELWRGLNGLVPATGAQSAELNGNAPATLYQDVTTVPGQTLRWSIQHRGRDGSDTMRVAINAAGAALVSQDEFTDTNAAWAYHTGAYVVPAGQTSTRISLVAVSTYNNQASVGNLLDDVSFGSGACLQAASAISNVTTGSTTTFRVGETVQYTTTVTNTGGASANSSAVQVSLPSTLTFVPGSLVVDGSAVTDAGGDDEGNFDSGTKTVFARIGDGATASVGGFVSTEASITVTYRAVIGSTAGGASITHTPVLNFVDPFAPAWPITVTGTTLTTSVANASDLSIAVLAQPNITPGAAASWTFRVTNNGPSASTGVSVALTLTTGPTYGTVTYTTSNAGAGTANCTGTGTTRTCAIGAIPAGEGRTITVPATLPASPTSLYPVNATVSSTSYDWNSANNTATNTGVDVTAPTAPTNFTATRQSASSISLGWTASTDAVGVTGYRVYRNGALIATTAATSYVDNGLSSGQPYWYWVVAIDAASNASATSTGAGAVTIDTAAQYRIAWTSGATTMCLGASSNSATAATVTSQTCANVTSQRWTFAANSAAYRISPVDVATRGWNLAANSSASNTNVDVNTANSGANRALWVPSVLWDSTTSTAYVQIFTNLASTTQCVEVTGGSTTAGAQLQLNACSNVVYRRYVLTVMP